MVFSLSGLFLEPRSSDSGSGQNTAREGQEAEVWGEGIPMFPACGTFQMLAVLVQGQSAKVLVILGEINTRGMMIRQLLGRVDTF